MEKLIAKLEAVLSIYDNTVKPDDINIREAMLLTIIRELVDKNKGIL